MAAKDLYEKDFYKVLGVDKKASADEIKKKYRSLARDLHPDKNQGDTAREEKFKAVSEAYDILSDSKKRAEYDEARSMFERGGFRAPTGGGNYQGDKLNYAFWNIPTGASSTVRFLPDANPDNALFWVEKLVIKLPFPGVKGGDEHKEVLVQVFVIEWMTSLGKTL